QLYIFRSSMTRPVSSPSLCFAHRRFGDRTSVRLSTWWLVLGRVGLFTHWVTMTIFKGVTLFLHPGFTLGTSTVLVRREFQFRGRLKMNSTSLVPPPDTSVSRAALNSQS